MFAKLFLIHQLHVTHQFNLLYFCTFCAKCNHFVWWCVTAKLYEGIYLLWCDSFYNNFNPPLFHSHFHCGSFCSFVVSCCVFPVCYSNGFLLTHEVNSDYVLANKLFCYISINMWEECRCYLHVTFLPRILLASWICFEQYFCILWRWFCSPVRLLWYCYINNTIVLLWAGGCMIWRQWYWRYDVTCTFFSRSIVSSHTSIHVQNSIPGFICPPWVVTDLDIAFNRVFWSSVKFTSKFVRMCRIFSDSGFEYPSACAMGLFNCDAISLYTQATLVRS